MPSSKIIRKKKLRVKPNLDNYDKTAKDFSWKPIEKEIEFFKGGKINVAHNAVDRHAKGWRKNKVALYWEGPNGEEEKYTFQDLKNLSNKFANVLKKLHVRKGDRVFIFLPRIPELYISFLGIVKTGAIAGTMFSAFGPQGIKDRLENSGAKFLITNSELKHRVYQVEKELPELEKIILVNDTHYHHNEVSYEKEMSKASRNFKVREMDPEDYAFMLYTSGTTGKPKGVMHAHYAIVQEHITAKWVLDLHDDDVYWCVPKGTTIICNPEPKPIDDITINDRVLTYDGKFSKVLKTFKRDYSGDLIKIRTYYSAIPMYLTPNHKVLVLRKRKNQKKKSLDYENLEWIKASEITKFDFVLFPVFKETNDIEEISVSSIVGGYVTGEGLATRKKMRVKIKDKLSVDKDFMRLIGYYLSEGSIGAKGRVLQFSFGLHEEEYANDVKDLIKSIFELDAKKFIYKKTLEVRVNSTLVAELFKKLFGTRSEEKRLPSHMLYLPKEKLEGFIVGFWRGDGDTERDGFRFSTVSKVLAYQLKLMLNKLGVLVSLSITKRDRVGKSSIGKRIIEAKHDCHYLRIKGTSLERMSDILNQKHKFIESRGNTYHFGHISEDFIYTPILDITKVRYDGEVYNLKTETETYSLNNMIVHNCTADPGWVTGVAYEILGSWSNGVSQVVYAGRFNPEKWYSLIEKYKASIWYTAPTAIRMLMKAGNRLPKKYDLSSLRHLCSVGEPLNPEPIRWSLKVFGLPFHDNWWQTEGGGILIANYPCMPIKPGSMGKPFPGVKAAIVDDKGKELPPGTEGDLALKPGWPSMMREIWRNPKKYKSYFIGKWYISGDKAWMDKDGYFWFIGRADDVIKTAGERVGPFEVESALVEHPAIVESGVIGKPDPVRGEIIKAFVVLRERYKPSKKLEDDIKKFVKTRLAGHAYPKEIEFRKSLPKTRSGKIMRRLLKAQELGLPLGDTSTLEEY